MPLDLPEHMHLYAYDEVSSTMDLAREHAQETSRNDIAVVWAKTQGQGRGRRGRQWSSEAGNLYCSFVVYPTIAVQKVYELSFVGALAVGDTLHALGIDDYKLKWPNDVFIKAAKVSGVLLELETLPDDRYYVVIGVGINVKHAPSKMMYPTTFLEDHCQNNIEVSSVLEQLSKSLFHRISMWEKNGFSSIREEWLKKSLLKSGDPIVVKTMGGTIEGHMLDLGDTGVLIVKTAAGDIKHINAGDVYF